MDKLVGRKYKNKYISIKDIYNKRKKDIKVKGTWCKTLNKHRNNNISYTVFFNIVRDSTELNATRLNYYAGNGNTAREVDGTITLTNLDEPNTTSATTYKCQFKCLGSSGYQAEVNQNTNNTPVSSITVMEIAG